MEEKKTYFCQFSKTAYFSDQMISNTWSTEASWIIFHQHQTPCGQHFLKMIFYKHLCVNYIVLIKMKFNYLRLTLLWLLGEKTKFYIWKKFINTPYLRMNTNRVHKHFEKRVWMKFHLVLVCKAMYKKKHLFL